MKIKKAVFILVLARLLFSALTLSTFPPFYGDELENSFDAQHYLQQKNTTYTLIKDVIHPHFYEMAAQSQAPLRGFYYSLLNVVQMAVGRDYVATRIFSFFIFLLTSWFLFLVVKRLINPTVAFVSCLLWTLSPDALIASHLIRPDILLGFFMMAALVLLIQEGRPPSNLPVFFAGLLGGLAVGLHPHGLIFFPWLFLVIWLLPNSNRRIESSIFLMAGLLAGLLVSAYQADWPDFMLSQHSLQTLVFKQSAHVWPQRFSPLTLLADSIFIYLQPSTYYLNNALRHPTWWPLIGLSPFLLLSFSFVWLARPAWKDSSLRIFFWSLPLLFLLIGFGHLKDEFIYVIPTTLMALPLISLLVVNSYQQWRPAFKAAHILGAVGFALLFWVSRFNPIMMLLLLLVPFFLLGSNDKYILTVAGLGLVTITSLWIRNKNFMTQVSSFSNFGIWICALLLISIFIGWFRPSKFVLAALFQTTFLTVFISTSAWALLLHEIVVFKYNVPLKTTFNQIETVLGSKEGSILGPGVLWYRFGERLKDVDGTMGDYYYSGQLRTASCIQRARPRFLIVDEIFERKFLNVDPSRKNIEMLGQQLSSMLAVSVKPLGSVPGSLNIPELDIFVVSWDSH